tara:strand:- start:42 stop:404 length:363 start_codon:yes stop_codon:yes gene_type:complete
VHISNSRIAAILGVALTVVSAIYNLSTRESKCGISLLDPINVVPAVIVLAMMSIGYFLVVLSESKDIQLARSSHGKTGTRGKINSSRFLQYFLSSIGVLGIWVTAYVLYSDSQSICQSAL